MTAYYEPFNERRWFDRKSRGAGIDPTHINVDAYWLEYEGMDELAGYFDDDWKFRHLYMNAASFNPSMRKYLEMMIEGASGRPVLQFNEVDFRLAWLRACFPGARIVHICRNPREQWRSTMRGTSHDFASLRISQFEALDGYYLLRWGRDLAHYFPFLALDGSAHPYKLFYQLWRLSCFFGALHADHVVTLEELVARPADVVKALFANLGVEDYDIDKVISIVSVGESRGLRSDGEESLMHRLESEVIEELDWLFGNQQVARRSPQAATQGIGWSSSIPVPALPATRPAASASHPPG